MLALLPLQLTWIDSRPEMLPPDLSESVQTLHSDDPVATVNQFRGALQDGNVAQVLGLLAPDVLIFESGEQQASRDEYAAHHLKADIAVLAKVYVDTLGQSSRVDGNTAWVATRSRLVSREADPRPPATVAETIVLRRTGQGWQIVHVHWSAATPETGP